MSRILSAPAREAGGGVPVAVTKLGRVTCISVFIIMDHDSPRPPPAPEEAAPPAGHASEDVPALLAQVECGSQEALVTLHRRYVNLVYSLALRITQEPMAAEEVTQDVFLKVWRQPRAYDSRQGRFTSWLLTVTRHAAIDRLRREGRRPLIAATIGLEDHEQAETLVSADTPGDSEQYRHLRLVLEQLPAGQREAIELAYFGGMSQQDIADYLHLPLGTVKTRIRLGMEKVRAMWLHES